MTPKEVIALAQENEARVVDVKFCDLLGSWQHFSMPVQALSEEMFEDGLGFDGSSIRGFQKINESDMLLIPDPGTAIMDPFTEVPTLSILCDIQDPITRTPTAATRATPPKRPPSTCKAPASRTPRFSGPRPSSTSSKRVRYDTRPTPLPTRDSDEGI
jgi:glutamine synthetase